MSPPPDLCWGSRSACGHRCWRDLQGGCGSFSSPSQPRRAPPIMIVLGGAAVFLFMWAGDPSTDSPRIRLRAHDAPDAAGASTVHARRIPAGRGGDARPPAAPFPGAVRMDTGRNGHRLRHLVGVLHHLHRRFRRDNPRAGGPSSASAAEDGSGDRFSLGLLTGSAALGLLLPPALPLILYAIVAEISVSEMMVGGILPGLVLIGLGAAHAVRGARRLGQAVSVESA